MFQQASAIEVRRWCKEIFGPVFSVDTGQDLDQLIEYASDSEYVLRELKQKCAEGMVNGEAGVVMDRLS